MAERAKKLLTTIDGMSHEELRQRWRTDFAAVRADIDTILLNRQVHRRLADSLHAAEGRTQQPCPERRT